MCACSCEHKNEENNNASLQGIRHDRMQRESLERHFHGRLKRTHTHTARDPTFRGGNGGASGLTHTSRVASSPDQRALCVSLYLVADGGGKSLSHKTSSKSSRRRRLPVIAACLDYPRCPEDDPAFSPLKSHFGRQMEPFPQTRSRSRRLCEVLDKDTLQRRRSRDALAG